MKGFRKHFRLKNLKERHRHDFAHNPKLIGLKSLKRKPFQMPMIFQFPESGFDALSLMIKFVQFSGGKFQVGGYSVVVGMNFQLSVFPGMTDSSDDYYPGSETVFQDDLSEVADCNTLSYLYNPSRTLPGKLFEKSYSVFHNIETGGSSDGIPERKLFQTSA